jgi:hypothetical protein
MKLLRFGETDLEHPLTSTGIVEALLNGRRVISVIFVGSNSQV